MNVNTSKEKSFYTQGQRFAARVLCIVWLLASGSPESVLAIPKRQPAMTPALTTSPGDHSLASTPPALPPGGILQLPPDSPGSFWGDSAGSSPSIDAALQERMSQEAVPSRGRELLRTSPKVSPVEEHLSFQARGGERVRFAWQQGQWRAEVSSHIGDFSRRAVLPVVCSQGTDVASSLEVLSNYPSWQRQRQIHVLDRNVCPTLGEVVYVGELGLKGGGEGEASGSGEQKEIDPELVKELRALASDLEIDQHPDKLAELGAVLLKLAKAKQEEKRNSAEDLSPYTEAAILYQHVLSICEPKAGTLGSQEAPSLEQSAYQGLAQIQASMLAQGKGADPEAITVEEVQARISADKQRLGAIRTKARGEAERLAKFRDKQGTAEEVRGAEAVYIEGSKKLFFDIAKAIKSLLGDFYQAGEQALGLPPCQYAIMGVGSIALQQTTPYSDLEFAILMEDAPGEVTAEAWRAYFRKLTHLVHFRVINLGETVLPFSEYKVSLDHLGRKGLNFDLGGKTPLGRKDKGYELIQPVAGMMAYLKNEGNKMEHIDKLLPYILERTCYMYGDRGLHDRYLEAQKEFWSSCQDAAGKHAYQERMRKVLLEGITELDQSQPGVVKAGRKQAGNLRTVGPKLHPEDAGRLYDVKQEIYRLPDRLLYGLATYYGLRPESAWDAVEQLKTQGIIGVSEKAKQAVHRLQYAVSFATMLRLATYIRYGQQKEALAGSASIGQAVSELFALPKEALAENGSLFKYYYTALALHSEMNGFFKVLHLRSQIQPDRHLHRMLSVFSPGGKYTAGKEKEHFHSSGFYDTSCAVKIAIYNRLLEYEQAAKCAEAHLEQVKRGYNQKKIARAHHNLGVSYYHLGNFDQSFDHFKTSSKCLKELNLDRDPQVAAQLVEILRSLGVIHYNLSKFQESLEYFKESLKMLQGLYGEKNPETAQALVSVGAAYEQIGKFQESFAHKQQALQMLQTLYPEKDPEVARSFLSLGETCSALGQLEAIRDQKEDALAEFQQSLEHKQKALQMFKDLYGKIHPEVARALLSLGESYALAGQLAASLGHKQKALEMFEALYGRSHPEVARARLSLGEHYALIGKLEESSDLQEQSWQMFQCFYDDHHPEVVRALDSLNETRRRRIQGEGSGGPFSGHSLRAVRIAHPQALTLLSTPRHGKEPAGENTLLRNYYSQTDFPYVKSLFEGQSSKHVKDLECQLMLLEQKVVKQDKDKEGVEAPENHIAKHHERRFEWVKTALDAADLFKQRSIRPGDPKKEISRILLTGDPGTGKTTLSRQLAYQWSEGQWGQEFHTLYLIPVRSLQQSEYDGTRYNREKTLSTAIVNTCFSHDLPATEAEYTSLRAHIDQELDKPTTLVILDGLDERAGASKEILRQAQSGTHKLLMLSRPYDIETERQRVDIEIEHVGFNRGQLEAYVQSELPDRARSAELLGYIGKHANIQEIAHVPVNLQILCALWQDEDYGVDREELDQGSLPGLYRLFIEFTWKRYKERAKEGVSPQAREHLFDKLGQIALCALDDGEVLIKAGRIHKTLSNSATDVDEIKQKCQDAGFLLLQYVGEDADKQQGFYEFPHLTFQEYFAGRTLARQFLSETSSRDHHRSKKFLSKHKYAPQYGRTLSFMSGEVSRSEGVEGIQNLLALLGPGNQAGVALQHLLLQLRVVHEWLCMARSEVKEDMEMLEGKFGMLSLLQEWFVKGLEQVRITAGHDPASPGGRLLGLLTDSLQVFRSVLRHAPKVLALLQQYAKYKEEGKYGGYPVRQAAVEALGQALSVIPDESEAILKTLREAAKDEWFSFRKAAVKSLGQALSVVPGESEAILATLREAAKDVDGRVRQAAVESLGQALSVIPDESEAILKTLREAAKDEDYSVRKSAVAALGQALSVVPGEPSVILATLYEAAKDRDNDVRSAAIEALGVALSVVPGESDAILATLREAAKDKDENVRQAASKFLNPSMDSVGASAINRPFSQGNPQRFTGLLKTEASQIEQTFHTYKLGKELWERYYGAVGAEPALPAGIEGMMDSACPFWPEHKLKDTHLLVLIPSHVSGKPLTLNYLGQLIQSPQRDGYGTNSNFHILRANMGSSMGSSRVYFDHRRVISPLRAIEYQSPSSSYWVLMTRGVLPGSRDKNYEDQCALVSDHAKRTGLPYAVPRALEAAVVMLLHHVRSGERLYSDNPLTYTRCQEKVRVTYTRCQEKVRDCQLFVGGFSSGGLNVYGRDYVHYNDGVAGFRKF